MFEATHEPIPARMRAARLHELSAGPSELRIDEIPVPSLADGEVLVKVMAAPVHPTDLMLLRGAYAFTRPIPLIPGFEGAGIVVAAGGGLAARAMLGRKVAVAVGRRGEGTWAEYTAAPLRRLIPLRRHVSIEQGAGLVINPFAARALIARIKRGEHSAFLSAGAGGELGHTLARLAQREGLTCVHVVRRASLAESVRRAGARHVLAADAPDFDERLAELAEAIGASIALDPVGGAFTSRLAGALPAGGELVVYGQLAGAPLRLDPGPLLWRGVRLEGFWLNRWFDEVSVVEFVKIGNQIQTQVEEVHPSAVRARVGLDELAAAIKEYEGEMSAGKILILPHQDEARAA